MQRPYIGNNIGINMGQYQQPIQLPPQQTQQKKQQKALVGFGQVPKFVPPAYDNVAPDDLPCPDTPSPRGSLASEDLQNEQNYPANNLSTHMNHTGNILPQSQPAVQAQITSTSNMTGATSSRGRNTSSQGVQNSGKPYPPGSFVEYRSRTMQDRWILAKVEAFDEKNKVYKLDVQPKAPFDRVRLRQRATQEPEPADKPSRPGDTEVPQSNAVDHVNKPPQDVGQQGHSLADLYSLTPEQMQKKIIDLVSENNQLRTENNQLRRQLESGRG